MSVMPSVPVPVAGRPVIHIGDTQILQGCRLPSVIVMMARVMMAEGREIFRLIMILIVPTGKK